MTEKSVTKKTIITEVEHHHPHHPAKKEEHHVHHQTPQTHHIQHHTKSSSAPHHVEHRTEHHPVHHAEHHLVHHTSAGASSGKRKKEKVVSNRLEMSLAQNIVELQKVHAHLADKFDRLAGQMASLLSLFEGAAKTFTNNPAMKVNEKDREFLDKIDRLLEQNKVIAKGLTMMEERARSQISLQQNQQNPSIESSGSMPSMAQMEQVNSGESFRPGLGGRRPLPRF